MKQVNRKVQVDTSGLYELLNKNGNHHNDAVLALKKMKQYNLEPILTNFIVAEIYALILTRVGSEKARYWLGSNIWPIQRITEEDEKRAVDILFKYNDKTFYYTDATSFALMERLKIDTALSFDKHFIQYGFKNISS